MNKPVVGIVAGAVLGFIDGATAWFTPAVRPFMTGILLGSTVKGLVVGVLCGLFARKVHSNSHTLWRPCRRRPATITTWRSCCLDLWWAPLPDS